MLEEELQKVKEKVAELKRLKDAGLLQSQTTHSRSHGPPNNEASIFVGKIDPTVTKEKLDEFFSCCGEIIRTTIISDPFSGVPRHAYVEFSDVDSVEAALKLNNRIFLGHNIQVIRKRESPQVTAFKRKRRRATYKRKH